MLNNFNIIFNFKRIVGIINTQTFLSLPNVSGLKTLNRETYSIKTEQKKKTQLIYNK